MKKAVIILFFMTLALSLKAQQNAVYDYSNKELIQKPQPTPEFTSWLKENNEKLGIRAPESSKIGTRVTLFFIVDKNGKLTNTSIWRGIGQGYDQYAYDLFENNPNSWVPGSTKEGNVDTEVYYQLDFIKNKNSIKNKED